MAWRIIELPTACFILTQIKRVGFQPDHPAVYIAFITSQTATCEGSTNL